jgi:hypothetical protein
MYTEVLINFLEDNNAGHFLVLIQNYPSQVQWISILFKQVKLQCWSIFQDFKNKGMIVCIHLTLFVEYILYIRLYSRQ